MGGAQAIAERLVDLESGQNWDFAIKELVKTVGNYWPHATTSTTTYRAMPFAARHADG